MKTNVEKSLYKRIFGVGPIGCILSTAIAIAFYFLQQQSGFLTLSIPPIAKWSICILLVLVGLVLAFWTMRHLTPLMRGKTFITSGPYRFVRHPLYSILILVTPLLLATAMESGLYLFLLPIFLGLWRVLVRKEESYMKAWFGEDYKVYSRKTGVFLPKCGMCCPSSKVLRF